ncbi:MAG: DUF1700 domain-containing protein [Clostridia bacterium]|nr:DUF1700 domain-containing protein [Clostridia bacterium]
MTKLNFLFELRDKLSGLPKEDIEERLNFYSEMIEDRIEEGLLEEEAVAAIGTTDEIAKQIIYDTPFTKIAKEKLKPKNKPKIWEIILLVLGFPLWLPLSIAAFAVAFSLYIALWAVIISFWAVFASFIGCAVGGVISAVVFAVNGNTFTAFAILAAALICAGLSIFIFFGCKLATKGILLLTEKVIIYTKSLFVKKGEVK